MTTNDPDRPRIFPSSWAVEAVELARYAVDSDDAQKMVDASEEIVHIVYTMERLAMDADEDAEWIALFAAMRELAWITKRPDPGPTPYHAPLVAIYERVLWYDERSPMISFEFDKHPPPNGWATSRRDFSRKRVSQPLMRKVWGDSKIVGPSLRGWPFVGWNGNYLVVDIPALSIWRTVETSDRLKLPIDPFVEWLDTVTE